MNGLDIFIIILIIILVILGIIAMILWICEDEIFTGIIIFIVMLIIASLFTLPFLVIDKASGATVGKITSVDKNFFGTTAVYIKTSETEQEKYCIEFNEELENKAKELIGKNVKISYGTRVGLYSTGKCSQAPIEKIEEVKE